MQLAGDAAGDQGLTIPLRRGLLNGTVETRCVDECLLILQLIVP
jgi:hypothetical protein